MTENQSLSSSNNNNDNNTTSSSINLPNVLQLVYDLVVTYKRIKYPLHGKSLDPPIAQMKALLDMYKYYSNELPNLIDETKVFNILDLLISKLDMECNASAEGSEIYRNFKELYGHIKTIKSLVFYFEKKPFLITK